MSDLCTMRSIEDLLGKRGVSVMVIGLSGNGKTASCRGLDPDRTLFVIPDIQGVRVLTHWGWTHGRFEVPGNPEEYKALVTHFIKHDQYQTLVIDTLNVFVDELIEKYERDNKVTPDKSDWGRFRYASTLTLDFVNRAMDAVRLGKHFVCLCHQKAPLKPNEPLVPDIFGQLPEQVARKFDIICHATSYQEEGKPPQYRFAIPMGENYKKDLYGLRWPRDNDVAAVIHDAQEARSSNPTGGHAQKSQPQKRTQTTPKKRSRETTRTQPERTELTQPPTATIATAGGALPATSPDARDPSLAPPASFRAHGAATKAPDEVLDLVEAILERCQSLGKSRSWGVSLLQQVARTKDMAKLTLDHITLANDQLDNYMAKKTQPKKPLDSLIDELPGMTPSHGKEPTDE